MSLQRIRRAVAVLAACLAAGTVAATAVVDLTLAEILERADVIVYGQVREVATGPADGDDLRMRVVLDVDRDLSTPDSPRAEVVLRFGGGGIATAADTIEGVPVFEVGERVLIAAYAEEDLVSPVVGVGQGLWRLGPAGLTDERGRRLTPSPDGVAPDGEGGDLTQVLDALADVLAGEGEVSPALVAPEDGAPDGAEADDPAAVEPGPAPAVAEAAPQPEAGEGDPVRDETVGDEAVEDEGVGDEAVDADAAEADAVPAEAGPDPTAGDDGPDPDDGTTAGATTGDGGEGATAQVVRLREPADAALRTTVEEAAAAWRRAGVEVRIEWDPAAAHGMATADPVSFGPDALSFTVRRAGDGGIDVLIRADLAATATGVVAYELAGLLGAPRGDEGVLAGRFGAGGSLAPDAGDAALLREALRRLPGDLDGDGDVDFYDLVRLAEAYGRAGDRSAADLDGSGEVDDADLERLRDGYRFLPPSPEPPEGRTSGDAN